MVISLSIGMLVYFLLIRPLLMERRDGEIRYRSLWPAWLSLEESVYKPLFRWLIRDADDPVPDGVRPAGPTGAGDAPHSAAGYP